MSEERDQDWKDNPKYLAKKEERVKNVLEDYKKNIQPKAGQKGE